MFVISANEHFSTIFQMQMSQKKQNDGRCTTAGFPSLERRAHSAPCSNGRHFETCSCTQLTWTDEAEGK